MDSIQTEIEENDRIFYKGVIQIAIQIRVITALVSKLI